MQPLRLQLVFFSVRGRYGPRAACPGQGNGQKTDSAKRSLGISSVHPIWVAVFCGDALVASALFISLGAFFLGPTYPSGIMPLTRSLPEHRHIPAVTFVATVGQVGGAVIPSGMGALVQAIGINAFQIVI